MNSIFLISGTITFSHSIGKKMKHRYQSFTRIGRQFQSLERQVYADWTSVSFPFCQRSCLIWRTMANNDEYNDEYLCRDFFVGFNFWSRLSFQISEFRVHWVLLPTGHYTKYGNYMYVNPKESKRILKIGYCLTHSCE